jgi:amidophosphoribosyltransferase
MCGIFGLIGFQPASYRLIKGAERLQNRGERSTRVVTFDGEFFHNRGGLMPASLLFFDYDNRRLRGTSGIVHTRYATTGANTPEMLNRNMQPVFADRPGMALCSNGDLVNLGSQTQKLKDLGFSFQTQVDAKVIQNTLVEHMNDAKTYRAKSTDEYVERLFASVRALQEDLIGAYSVLALMDNGLLAFKDPLGIRPLSMALRYGEDGNVIEHGFASETSVFNYFGDYNQVEELKPGEAVFINAEDLSVHRKQITNRGEAFCFFEYVYFSRPDSRFNGNYVEVIRKRMGQVMAEQYSEFKDKLDVVCGLPGTAVSTGEAFGQALGVPVRNAIIKVGAKRSFQETSDTKRQKAIDDKFIFIRDFIRDRRVAIIDDSNVRGTTAKKIIRRLFELGAKEVHMFYYTPPIVNPCFYGIDTPEQERLIAFDRTNEQIRAEMGCNSVNYISIENLIRGLEHPEEKLCLACIAREYPTDIAEAEGRVLLRRRERAMADQSCS